MRSRMRRPIHGPIHRPRWLSLMTGATTVAALTLLGTATAQASPAVVQTAAAARAAAPVLAANTKAPCNVTPKPGDARCFAVVRTPADHNLRAAAEPVGPASHGADPGRYPVRLPAARRGGSGRDGRRSWTPTATRTPSRTWPRSARTTGCRRAPPPTAASARSIRPAGRPTRGDDSGWALETSLDLDAVSSACPRCHILLVEGSSPSIADLAAAENEAVKLGAKFISNSYGTRRGPGADRPRQRLPAPRRGGHGLHR